MTKRAADRITVVQMVEAIRRSGYLLEHRAKGVMEAHGFDAETNVTFYDPRTQKSREYDVAAFADFGLWDDVGKDGKEQLAVVLLCEAENNAQPVVFFQGDVDPAPAPLICGLPSPTWAAKASDQEELYVEMFLDAFQGHHYTTTPIATQYCSFRHPSRSQTEWIADHSEEQHDSFDKLATAVEDEMDRYRRVIPPTADAMDVGYQLYYLAVILQGTMMLAREKKGRLVFKKADHVVFTREVSSKGKWQMYGIDVVQEKSLGTYLEILKLEGKRFAATFGRHRGYLRSAMADMHSRLGREPEQWKPYLRPDWIFMPRQSSQK